MGYISMPHACFLAGTTKNPIKRAITRREVTASKDGLGHWRIDERSFLNWLRQRCSEDKSNHVGEESEYKACNYTSPSKRYSDGEILKGVVQIRIIVDNTT